jgi:LuxR family maltose regulon positive regulatory protein
MYAGLCEVLNRQDRLTLDRWQRLLPEEMFQQQPQLLMIRIWSLEFQWKLDLQFQLIQQLEVMLGSDVGKVLSANDLNLLQGQILGLKAQWAYFSNQPQKTIDLCRQVLALIPSTWKYVRGGVMIYLGLSMQANGQGLAAEQLLLNEYEACNEKTEAYALEVIESLGFIYINNGQLEDAIRIGLLLAQGGASGGLGLLKNWGDYYLGVAYFERYELEIAEQYFSRVIENRFTAQLACYHDSAAGLVIVRQLMGKDVLSWQVMENLSQFDMEQSGREDDRTHSLRARLMLLQGNMEGASQWVDTFTDPPPDVPIIWLEEPHITRARILIARGTDADLRLALQILSSLDEIANRTHNTRRKIEILTLRAQALDALGQNEAADTDLGQALALSRQGGFTRVYVDLGKPMQRMLQRVARQNHSMEIIQHILAAFPEDGQNPTVSGSAQATALYPMPLIVPLTSRELEVLNLLRGPLSVKEIALKLGISYATAKRHTINIYGKLNVNQRWSAVAKAEELNLLSPH